MRPSTFLVAVLAVTPFTIVTAQDSVQVKPGDRVRVAYCTSKFLPVTGGEARTRCRTDEGTIRTIAADSLVLVTGASDRAVPVDAISKFEVRVRQEGHAVRGAVIGALVGIAVGAGIGTALAVSCNNNAVDSDDAIGCALWPAVTVPPGLALGTIAGAVIGGAKGAKWEDVPLDQLRVSFGPQRGGKLRLGISLRF